VFGVAGAVPGAWMYDTAIPGAAARISSFGAVFGALAGAAIFFRFGKPGKLGLAYLDVLAYAFPFGWAWLRLGSVLVHDHPGRLTASWLGVQFPGGARYDLGLLEMLLSVAAAGLFVALGRKPRAPGFFLYWMVVCAPIRVALDSLRENPAKVGGFTVDQWGGLAITLAGVWVVSRVFMTRRVIHG